MKGILAEARKGSATTGHGVMAAMFARISWIWVLIGWTFFVWLSRLRNVLISDELSSSGRAVRVGVVVIFVALAGFAAVAVRRRQPRIYPQLLVVFLAWTVGYWLIRGTGILIDGDHAVGFKVVHTVLMAVSIILSALTARQLRLGR